MILALKSDEVKVGVVWKSFDKLNMFHSYNKAWLLYVTSFFSMERNAAAGAFHFIGKNSCVNSGRIS